MFLLHATSSLPPYPFSLLVTLIKRFFFRLYKALRSPRAAAARYARTQGKNILGVEHNRRTGVHNYAQTDDLQMPRAATAAVLDFLSPARGRFRFLRWFSEHSKLQMLGDMLALAYSVCLLALSHSDRHIRAAFFVCG